MKQLICPECKNTVDLSDYSNLEENQVVECNHCGMTLMVTGTSTEGAEEYWNVEIVDEGK